MQTRRQDLKFLPHFPNIAQEVNTTEDDFGIQKHACQERVR